MAEGAPAEGLGGKVASVAGSVAGGMAAAAAAAPAVMVAAAEAAGEAVQVGWGWLCVWAALWLRNFFCL